MNLQGIDVAVLSGTSDPLAETLLGFELGEATSQDQLDAMFNYLVSTRNSLAQDPSMIAHVEDPEGFIKMLDYAIRYWNTDQRNQALAILEANELQLNQLHGLYGQEGLGAAKNFFQSVKTFAQKASSGVKTAAKTVAKAVVKYNPISLAARGGFLIAMKLNLRKMATKLKWAYGTQSQAAQKGVSANQWNQAKTALVKIENLFADKLQGDRNALRDAILKGKAGGLSGLGEPVTLAASIAAATPVIVATLKIMKDAGLLSAGEDANTGNLASEAEALNNSITDAMPYAADPSPAQPSPSGYADAGVPAIVNNTPGANPPSSGGGIVGFVKNNPAVAAIGAGVIAFGAYKMLKPKKKAKGLSGARSTPGRKRAPAKRTSAARSTRKTTKSSIQKVKLL